MYETMGYEIVSELEVSFEVRPACVIVVVDVAAATTAVIGDVVFGSENRYLGIFYTDATEKEEGQFVVEDRMNWRLL